MSSFFVAVLLVVSAAHTVDWPTFRHDPARSGATTAVVRVRELKQVWSYHSPVAPQPAWDATARQDAYHGIAWLPERRLYDASLEPIVVGQTIYFGSSVDDSLHSLDVHTGRPGWQRTVGGPIRVAPNYHDRKIYFGADDGFAYCVDAESGELVWRFTVTQPTRLVLQDGRFVSPLACRTGVVVREDLPGTATAYFCESLLPWDDSYLCAVDANTGQPTGAGRFMRRTSREGHFDGPLSVSDKLLYCPRGNSAAEMFTRGEGAPLGHTWAATGGFFALFFPQEDRILAGGFAYQGKAALLDAPLSGAGGPSTVKYVLGVASASLQDGVLYLQYPDKVQAVRRATGESLWTTTLGATFCVSVAADAVFVGGDDCVVALDRITGERIWQAPTVGRVYSLVLVDGAVIASTDQGVLTCFQPLGDPIDQVLPSEPPVAATPARRTKLEPIELRAGPSLRFLDRGRAEVTWETSDLSPTILEFGPTGARQLIHDKKLQTKHRAVVSNLLPRRVYPYRIRTVVAGTERETAEFLCDSYLNYSRPPISGASPPKGAEVPVIASVARWILDATKVDQGLCLVIGAADQGTLAWRLAKETRLNVLIVDESLERVDAARQLLLSTGTYGARVAAMQVESLDQLPLPSHLFRLIVSADAVREGKCTSSALEVERLLDPVRGVAMIGQPPGQDATLSAAGLQRWTASVQRGRPDEPLFHGGATTVGDDNSQLPRTTVTFKSDDSGQWAVLRLTGGLPGARPWTHQYASVANTACSNDTLQGATRFSQMTTQWIGRPGGRYQADRMVRKPAPLAAHGRLIVQGQGNLICIDCASGNVDWTFEIPGLARFNMVRDASNYCTDGEFVYLAFKDRCWVIDLASGHVVQMRDVVLPPGRQSQHWSYIATEGERLLGSSTTPGTAFTNFWGGGAWYEHNGWEKVCSDSLFALDKRTFDQLWQYTGGVIINATIAADDRCVYFLETRQPEVLASDNRMLNGPSLWAAPWLVALNLATGEKVWERSFATDAFPSAQVMCGLVSCRGKLIFHGSSPANANGGPKGYFHLRAFDAASGEDAWQSDDPWAGYGHGIQTSYPVVVGDKVFYSPHVFNVENGTRLPLKWNEGHCGTTSASCHALFYRYTTIAFWDILHSVESRWPTVRPDCWLSVIPAEGMLLAPEGGGGCVCGGWLETSVALAPRTDFATFRTKRKQFLGSMEIELDPPVGGAVVYYTTDQSEPTVASPSYGSPIRITETTTIRTRVYGGRDSQMGGPVVSQRYERIRPVTFPSEGRVEFQPIAIGGGAKGDLIDFGESMGLRPDGHAYGWLDDAFESFWAVDSAKRTDAVRDTLVWFNSRNSWEIALNDGEYEVTLLVGNPDGETKRKEAGAIWVADQSFELDRDLSAGEMLELTHRVRVTGGKLRLRKDPSDPTSIGLAYLRFRSM